ncbi:hypothetical protein CYMTET_49311 [Cymbomonas tetramitiformis]|uniref:N-acetyl-D-glucosamine kinase n=1 Tax=Cymbomonas tetramitiformis TaxID=36881 RepID=A0AAE0EUN7_9CHLO|nr:hypothetical protein CYMTET_49311 [Cymbomonas tetramitiformis]
MSSKGFYLGVDGGGTKTTCVIVDTSRKTVGRGVAQGSNKNSVGNEVAQRELMASVELAVTDAGISFDEVSSACFALSGCDRPDDVSLVTSWMKKALPTHVHVWVYNDALGALASGTQGVLENAAVLISGTGTIALGVDSNGQQIRAAGWGPLLGDCGSGFDVAQKALTASAAAHDGRGHPTALLPAILEHLSLERPEDLIGWVYGTPGWAHIASLAPIVFECAARRDAVSEQILTDAANALARSVSAVASRLRVAAGSTQKPPTPSAARLSLDAATSKVAISEEHLDRQKERESVPQSSPAEMPFTLVLAGGLLGEGSSLEQVVRRELAHECPGANVVHAEVEPAVGAALIALNKYNALSDDM